MTDVLTFPDASLGAREVSRWRVLEAIRSDGPMARVELGQRLGMSPAAISEIAAGLIRDGILAADDEAEASPATRGRPKQRLTFAPELGCVVAAWLGHNRIELCLVDGAGRPVARRRVAPALKELGPEALLDAVAGAVDGFRAGEGRPRIEAVGIAVQGYVDAEAGALLWSPVLNARAIGMAEGLRRRLGCPVVVENDAGAVALALSQRDPALRAGRTAFLMIGDGVGFSLLIEGALYRGARSGGSEFGHARLRRGGPQCRCGRRGCVEAFVADYALRRDAQVIDPSLPPPGPGPDEETMQALVRRAEAGDLGLRGLFASAGEALADAVGIIVQTLLPDALVLCGPGMRAYSLYEPCVRDALDQLVVPDLKDLTALHVVDLSPSDLTAGVALQALRLLDRSLAQTRAA